MAVAAYYRWEREGRPLEPAQPVREIVERMKAAYPKAANTFSWYANESHYQAVPAQDHTPYSQTGWPLTSPEWWVFATDIMHHPELGVDCNALFAYWLAEAKAGRMPWLKYLIWQAQLYDVRNQWRPQSNSGHFDHIHLSVRTDWQHKGLGSWSITPQPQEVDMFLAQVKGDPHQYLSTGLKYRWITNPVNVKRLQNAGVPLIVVDFAAELGDLCGEFDTAGPDPVTLTPEALAAVAAAAKAGAEQGGPPHEELVKAAEEGANLAEDS